MQRQPRHGTYELDHGWGSRVFLKLYLPIDRLAVEPGLQRRQAWLVNLLEVTFPALRWWIIYGLMLTFARALGEFGAIAGGGWEPVR